jgi:hypothetical protein
MVAIDMRADLTGLQRACSLSMPIRCPLQHLWL